MKIDREFILQLRSQYLKRGKHIKECYLPRFVDDSDLCSDASVHSIHGLERFRYYGITFTRDNSEFNNNIRIVFEQSEVIPYE